MWEVKSLWLASLVGEHLSLSYKASFIFFFSFFSPQSVSVFYHLFYFSFSGDHSKPERTPWDDWMPLAVATHAMWMFSFKFRLCCKTLYAAYPHDRKLWQKGQRWNVPSCFSRIMCLQKYELRLLTISKLLFGKALFCFFVVVWLVENLDILSLKKFKCLPKMHF